MATFTAALDRVQINVPNIRNNRDSPYQRAANNRRRIQRRRRHFAHAREVLYGANNIQSPSSPSSSSSASSSEEQHINEDRDGHGDEDDNLLAMMDDALGDGPIGDAALIADIEEEEKERWEQCGLPTRQAERNELGIPAPRSQCFGCNFVGERETGAIMCVRFVFFSF